MRLVHEPAAEDQRGDRVDQAHAGDGDQQQRARERRPRVQDDLQADLRCGPRDAEHGHVDVVVVVLVLHRQRPVVRGSPEEHQHEQHEGRPIQRAGDGRPADQHREASCDAAPDDVLLRAALQDQRVDHHVEEDRGGRQHGGDPVRGQPQPDGRERREHPGEDQRATRRHLAGHERTLLGAVHVRIDVAVDVHVERRRGSGAHRAADHGRGDQPEIRQTVLREEHHRHGGDEQELEHTRLGQLDIGLDGPLQRALGGDGLDGGRDADRLLHAHTGTLSSYATAESGPSSPDPPNSTADGRAQHSVPTGHAAMRPHYAEITRAPVNVPRLREVAVARNCRAHSLSWKGLWSVGTAVG